MRPPPDRRVDITENGRSGSVVYREHNGSLTFYWEFGGGDVVTCINVGTAAHWRREHAWAADRRADILRFVADEVVRLKAPTCTAEIDEETGWMNLRQGAPAGIPRIAPKSAPATTQAQARVEAGAWVRRYTKLKMKLGLWVLGAAVIFAGVMWFKNKVLVIDPGKGTAVGPIVRTDEHIATLIQTLEPYTPSLDRNHGNDTYRFSIFLVPLDGSATKLIPIGGGFPSNAMSLAKILGSDGRTLWYDLNGVGGVDLRTYGSLPAGRSPDPGQQLQGARTSPFPLNPDAFLCAGWITGPGAWLGLHSMEELERDYQPKKFVRRVVMQQDAKQMRRFYRGVLDAPVDDKYHRILSMTPIGNEEYLNAAFLRLDDKSEPLRLTDPDGALMIHTSEPGLKGTLVVARVDIDGNALWTVDTGIDRFTLSRILPGQGSFAFVGTRPPIPDKVSEPLLVIVENGTGAVTTTSLWR